MTEAEYQFEILRILTQYFSSRKKALEVYKSPHLFFRDYTGLKRSMEEVVEMGNGEEVMNFLDMVLL